MSIEAVTSNEVNVGSLLYITGLSSKCGLITIPVAKLVLAGVKSLSVLNNELWKNSIKRI